MKNFDLEAWKKAIHEDNEAKILDVRSADEFQEGHIPGATLIDVQSPQEFMEEIESLDKNSPYYVYCNSGRRGEQACMVMDFNGFQNTYNLEGGYEAWQNGQ